jgi:MFS family permease
MTRDFTKLWAASAISDVGSHVSALALPLIAALSLGATAWQMGLLSAAGTAPTLLIGLFAGVWVDRLRRRPLLIAADLGRAALLLAIPLASVLDALRIELLCVVALLAGALTVLFDVSHVSFLPSLIGRERLVEANSRLEATESVARVTGPGLGGVLIGLLGAPFTLLIDALSFLASALFITRIRVTEPAPAHARAGLAREIREGLGAVSRHTVLQVLAGCSATTSFFGLMFMAVYVLYMTRDLGLGPVGVGLVFATGGVGALAGALVAQPLARRFGPGPAMIVAQLLFGLSGLAVPLAVLAPAVALPMIVGSEFAQWMTVTVYYVNTVSVRQAITPDRLQGRVNATIRFVAGGAMPLGSLSGGLLGGLIGLPLTLVVAEPGMLSAFLWLLLSPVRHLRTMPAIEHAEPALG